MKYKGGISGMLGESSETGNRKELWSLESTLQMRKSDMLLLFSDGYKRVA